MVYLLHTPFLSYQKKKKKILLHTLNKIFNKGYTSSKEKATCLNNRSIISNCAAITHVINDKTRVKNFGYINRYIVDILDIGEVRSDIGNQQSIGQSFGKMSVISPIYWPIIETS